MFHLSTALLLASLAVYLGAHELERRLQAAQAQHLLLLRRVPEYQRNQWRMFVQNISFR